MLPRKPKQKFNLKHKGKGVALAYPTQTKTRLKQATKPKSESRSDNECQIQANGRSDVEIMMEIIKYGLPQEIVFGPALYILFTRNMSLPVLND